MTSGPLIEIRYCTRCKWLLRAQWYAAELLQTFEDELGAVTLVPMTEESGTFRVDVVVDGTTTAVWNRKRDDGSRRSPS